MGSLRAAGLLLLPMFGSVLLIGQTAQSRAIDTERSTMTIRVYRSGLFSFAGDNHEIRALIQAGRVDETKQTVEFTVVAATLKVLDFKLSADKRAQVQQKMLSPDVLDPERYPEIRFRSTKVEQKGNAGLVVTGDLTLHGETHPVVVNVSGNGDHYTGKAAVKQTEFGMKPVTVGGGTVKVKDEVEIGFDIVTR